MTRQPNKTDEQIKRHISKCRFSDSDWEHVRKYCKEFQIKNIKKPASPKYEETFEQFISWVDNGYGVGDIVRVEGECGLFMAGDSTPEFTHLIAELNGDKLAEADMNVETQRLSRADDMSVANFKAMCLKQGLRLKINLEAVVWVYTPKSGSFVEHYYDKHYGCGLVEEITDECVVFKYCNVDDFLYKKYLVPLTADFKAASKNSLGKLKLVLVKNGYKLNTKTKMIERQFGRLSKGGMYWYISDTFAIRSAVEDFNTIANLRNKSGNYFINYSEALSFLQKIMAMRDSDD